MLSQLILTALTSTLILLIAVSVLVRLQGSPRAWGLFVLSVGIAIYLVALFVGWNFEKPALRLLMFRLVHFTIAPLLIGAWLFAGAGVDTVLSLQSKLWWKAALICFGITGLYSSTPLVVAGLRITDSGPLYGAGHLVFPIIGMLGLAGLGAIFIAGLREARLRDDTLTEFEIVFFGVSLMMAGVSVCITNVLCPHILGISTFVSTGPAITSLLWAGAQGLFLIRGVDLLIAYRSIKLRRYFSHRAVIDRPAPAHLDTGARLMLDVVDHMECVFSGYCDRALQFRIGGNAFEIGPARGIDQKPDDGQILKLWANEQAHQMQGPALNIRYAASTLRHRRVPFAEYPPYLDRIIALSTWILDNNRAVLDSALFAENSSNLLTINKHTPSIRAALLETLERAAPLYTGRLIIHLDGYHDFPVRLPPDLLRALILNLLKNSVRAIQNTEDPAIHFTLTQDSSYNCLILTDNGCGIPADRIDEVTKRGVSYSGSTGFGLSFCENLMRYTGGRLRIVSEEDMFTIVALDFP